MGVMIPCRNVLSHCLKSLEGNGFVFDKVSGIETEKEYHNFPPNIFASVPEIDLRESCRVSKKLWYRGRETVSRFSIGMFVSQYRKTS